MSGSAAREGGGQATGCWLSAARMGGIVLGDPWHDSSGRSAWTYYLYVGRGPLERRRWQSQHVAQAVLDQLALAGAAQHTPVRQHQRCTHTHHHHSSSSMLAFSASMEPVSMRPPAAMVCWLVASGGPARACLPAYPRGSRHQRAVGCCSRPRGSRAPAGWRPRRARAGRARAGPSTGTAPDRQAVRQAPHGQQAVAAAAEGVSPRQKASGTADGGMLLTKLKQPSVLASLGSLPLSTGSRCCGCR